MPLARLSAPPARWHAAMAVAVGGALGAAARYGIDTAWPGQREGFPLSTFLINVVGSAALGALLAFLHDRSAHPMWRPFVGGGLLGGFTTFSTYALQGYQLGAGGGSLPIAVLYLSLTPVTAVAAAGTGAVLTRRIVHPSSSGWLR